MCWLQNKSNSCTLSAQKLYFISKPFHMMSFIQLVVMIVIAVSFASAQMKYPKEKDDLVKTDDNILLTNTFLPFLDSCAMKDAQIEICSMYYDMVYNVYSLELNGNDTKKSIEEASKILDKPELAENFCEIFRNETPNTLDKQPFSNENGIVNVSEWIQMKFKCEINCLMNVNQVIAIKSVCKFISGGLKLISKQKNLNNLPSLSGNENDKQNGNANEDANVKTNDDKNSQNGIVTNGQEFKEIVVQKPIPNLSISNTSNNTKSNNSNPSSPKVIQTPSKTSENVMILEDSKPGAQPPKIADVTPKLTKKITSNVPVNKNNNVNSNIVDKSDSAQAVNKPTSASSIDIPIVDEDSEKKTDYANEYANDNAAEDDEPEAPGDPSNTNNNSKDIFDNHINSLKKSSLSADQARFREDTASSFFPYFMFLMFVVVVLYVAYHNKSKILALMIEGRRSRNYSSRGGGSRRKHSSAEYRKLDSNLEEAIQSEGGHVLSSQIIY